MAEGADMGPSDLVGVVAVEMVVAPRLQPGEQLVYLALLSDEGVQRRLPVSPGFLGAEFVAQGGDRGSGHWSVS